jgi:hypothetical protein
MLLLLLNVALGVPNRSALRFLFPTPTTAEGVPNLYRLPDTVRTVVFSFNPFLFFKGLVNTLSPLSAMTPFIRPSGKSFQESITASPRPLLEGNAEANKQLLLLLQPFVVEKPLCCNRFGSTIVATDGGGTKASERVVDTATLTTAISSDSIDTFEEVLAFVMFDTNDCDAKELFVRKLKDVSVVDRCVASPFSRSLRCQMKGANEFRGLH